MNELLQARLAAGAGTVRTAELLAAGFTATDVRRLVREGLLQRVRYGVYVDASRYQAADAHGRHELQVRAVLGALRGYAASHLSALVCWGLPVLRSDLGPVQLAPIDHGHARRSPGLDVRRQVPANDVRSHHGIPVVTADLAVLQACRFAGPRVGLMAAEAGLHAGLILRDDLVARERAGRWGAAAAQVVALADGRSESAGESWCRLVFVGLGLRPEQQVEIRDERAAFVARVDFLFRDQRLVVEFDGVAKYAVAQGREALVAEKLREDALRRLGYRVVRLIWADLADPKRVLLLLGL